MSQERNLEELEQEKLAEVRKIYVQKLARLEEAYAYETSEVQKMQLEYQLKQTAAGLARLDGQLAARPRRTEHTENKNLVRPRLAHPPSRPRLHKYVAGILPSDPELTQFCWQYYPKVHADFASGQIYRERLVLLLVRAAEEPDVLLDNLFAFNAERCTTHWPLLNENS